LFQIDFIGRNIPNKKRLNSMKKPKINKDIIDMTEKACEFINSPAGRKAYEDAVKDAYETVEVIREAQKVSWEKLYKPYDI
jgi:hypothetical protein